MRSSNCLRLSNFLRSELWSLPIKGRGSSHGRSQAEAEIFDKILGKILVSDHCPIGHSQGSKTVFERRLCRSMSISYGFVSHCHGRGREFESRRPRQLFQQLTGSRHLAQLSKSFPISSQYFHPSSAEMILSETLHGIPGLILV